MHCVSLSVHAWLLDIKAASACIKYLRICMFKTVVSPWLISRSAAKERGIDAD